MSRKLQIEGVPDKYAGYVALYRKMYTMYGDNLPVPSDKATEKKWKLWIANPLGFTRWYKKHRLTRAMIGKEIGCSDSNIDMWINERQAVPDKWVPLIKEFIKKYEKSP